MKTSFAVQGKAMNNIREWVFDCWNSVMDHEKNPLSAIPDFSTRHMIMQVLAWMWVIAFTIATGTWAYAGINAAVHTVLITAIVVTVAVFESAKRKPRVFGAYSGRGNGGEHE